MTGGFHGQLDEHIARRTAAQGGHAFGAQAHLATRLRATGNLYPAAPAVDGGHFDVTAKRGGGHRDRHAAIEIGALALKYLVRFDLDEDVEITRRTATHAGLAFASETNARAGFHPAGMLTESERSL